MPTKRINAESARAPADAIHRAVADRHRELADVPAEEPAVEACGGFRRVQALVTKALGAGVWQDPRFCQLWDAYRERKYDVEAGTVLPYGEEFDAGLLVGMWSGSSALSTITVAPWDLHDRNDKEPPIEAALAKTRRPGAPGLTRADLRQALGADGPTMAEHHLAAGVASAGFWMAAGEGGPAIADAEDPELPPFFCSPDPVTGGLLFRFAAHDPRLSYIDTRFRPAAQTDGWTVFGVGPSSLIGRFVRTVRVARDEERWKQVRQAALEKKPGRRSPKARGTKGQD